MATLAIQGGFTPRGYQLPYMNARDAGCKFLVWVCHRRGGKDRTALAQMAKDAMKRVGLYWHCLPTLRQARKVIWDGITSEGKNLIRATFPDQIVARRLEDDMKLELVNGSIVQLVGADNFDSLVGSNPLHVTFSEWALTDPRAYDYVRPILRENNGSVAFIFTPRGYNHGWRTLQIAQRLPGAFVAVMSIRETGVLSDDDIALERAMGMPEELIEQEYYVDFAAANVGAIVGRYVSAMERDGRFTANDIGTDERIVVSCDLGFRDAAAFWWWVLRRGGFHLAHYDEATGLDADEWITRLKDAPYRIDHLYLPHDAKARTFATRHTVAETMARAFECSVIPQTKIMDRVNAARRVLPHCTMDSEHCARGLEALRAWSFKWDDDKKIFSSEPDHNWASHGSDAFSYGAQVVSEALPVSKPAPTPTLDGTHYPFALNDLWRKLRGSHTVRL
jgi:phage terminase large subunit